MVPYFSRAYSMPETDPGTPTAKWPLVEMHAGGRALGRGLAEIEERLAAVGELDRHESAASEIAGRRVDHRQCIADRDRGIDSIAATPEHIHAHLRRKMLRRNNHAVFRGDWRDRSRVRRTEPSDADRQDCGDDTSRACVVLQGSLPM